MDLATFTKLIKTKKILETVYVFSGPEQFLKNKTFDSMAKALVDQENMATNVFKFQLENKNYPELIALLSSFVFNTDPRLFYIEGISSLGAKQKKDFLKAMQTLKDQPNTYIVFVSGDQKSAGELVSAFKPICEKIDFWSPFANKLPNWIKDTAMEAGCSITTGGADLLIELLGSDLATLDKEITKLAITHANKTIDVKEIRGAVNYTRQNNIFDLLNAVGERNKVNAVTILQSLITGGEPVAKIWFMLCKQFKEYRLFHDVLADRPELLIEIKEALVKYKPLANRSDFRSNQEKKNLISLIQEKSNELPETLEKALNLSNPIKLRHFHLALNYNHKELIKLWPKLLEKDLAIKFGPGDIQAFVTAFILETL
jgi:DNA polymerase-3 subunit delta